MNSSILAIRLTIGLSLLSVALLLGARWMGFIPDHWTDVRAGRRVLCDTVAQRCRAAMANPSEIPRLQARLRALLDLNPEVVSAVVRRLDGQLLAEAGDATSQQAAAASHAADTLWTGPITAGDQHLGELELRFQPSAGPGWRGYFSQPLLWLLGVSAVLNVLISVVVVHALPRASRKALRRQNKDLRMLAARDHLTDCLNRRRLTERLEASWRTSQRYGLPLSCVMLDIDHFKSINDRYGHAVGDDVIRRVAAVLQAEVRDSDIVGRYGGDEFCVLLPHLDLAGACQAAERYRALVAALEFPDFRVTLSLGVCSSTLGARSSQQLLAQADEALYAAKARGRNQVASWEGSPAEVAAALAAR